MNNRWTWEKRVFIALDFKNIPYEIVPQMPFSGDKEYLKINPLVKVPSVKAVMQKETKALGLG
ncbi:MAG: glutathione S-transferase N-terminal domain-containing protein [Halioglobus sp.]|nr:glutathione S-transferase N-terminal domain-containing protein [Halioglobus sp.]